MKSSDIPNRFHYALIEFSQNHIHHEGDERSRTHPGHGYPAYTETVDVARYESFLTKEELEMEVIKRHLSSNPAHHRYRIFEVRPMEVKTLVSVSIE